MTSSIRVNSLDREVSRMLPLQDLPGIAAREPNGIVQAGAVAHKPASHRKIAQYVNGRDTDLCIPLEDLILTAQEQSVCVHD